MSRDKEIYMVRDPNGRVHGGQIIDEIIHNNNTYFVPKFKSFSKSVPDDYARYLVYNPYLKHYVWLNRDSFISYLHQNEGLKNMYRTRLGATKIRAREYELDQNKEAAKLPEHYDKVENYPYQSIDMRGVGAVRFAPKEDLETWIRSRDEVNHLFAQDEDKKKIKHCVFDFPSEIDIFKMKRPINSYKYVYQLDTRTVDLKKVLYKHAETLCNHQHKKIFVPYLPETTEFDVEHHPTVNFSTVNESLFIEKLKASMSKDDMGTIMFSLNKIFEQYENINLSLEEILELEKKRAYGFTKDDIVEIMNKFKEALVYYEDEANRLKTQFDGLILPVQDCETLHAQIKQKLVEGDKLLINHEIGKMDKLRELCWYIKSDFKMLNDIFDKIRITNRLYEDCDKISFSHFDTYTNHTKGCNQVYIEDDNVRKILKEINIDTPDNLPDSQFNAHIDYMPEWKKYVMSRQYKDAFSSRQLLLSGYELTKYLRQCSFVIRSDPWYGSATSIKNVSWSSELNRAVLACVAKSDQIFPIRIDLDSFKDPIKMYTYIDPSSNILLGCFVFKLDGKRFQDFIKLIIIYLYWDANRKMIVLYNHRSNRVLPGTISDHIKSLYYEMNVLKYFDKDVGVPLYYYRKKETNTIYASRYSSLDNIYNKYIKMDLKQEAKKIRETLIPYDIVKNTDKEYVVEEVVQQVGGQPLSSYYYIKFAKVDWQYDTQFSSRNYIFDEEYPVDQYLEYKKVLEQILDKMGKDFFVYKAVHDPLYMQSKYFEKGEMAINATMLFKDSTDNFSKKMYRLLKSHKFENIMAYPFQFKGSIRFFDYINRFSLIKDNSKIVLFARNYFALEAIIYYQKFISHNFNPKNIFVYLYEYDGKKDDFFMQNILKKNRIDYHNIVKPLNNAEIKQLSNRMKDVDFAMIDLNLPIRELNYIRNEFGFQTTLSTLIMTLSHLNKHGNLCVYTSHFSNRVAFDFYQYLAQFFGSSFIYEYELVSYYVHFNCLIFKDYKGYNDGVDLDKLLSINEKNYSCDPSGGVNYEIVDTSTSKLLDIKYKSPNKPNCYLNKIVAIDNKKGDLYKKYCTMMESVYKRKIEILSEIYNIYLNQSLIPQMINDNFLYSINHLKNIGLPTVEWLDDKGFKRYFYHTIMRTIHSNITPYVKQFQYICGKPTVVGKYKEIEYIDKEHTLNIWKMSENVYQYVEKTDYRMWKNVELFFNNKQKTLQKFLKDEYNININGRYVSRAWVKMYELLNQTRYFDNLNKYSVKVLHICEAPGSFVAASIYYTKHNTEIKDYDYVAQSWKEGEIFDEFGFIKQNSKRWDFADGTGDIMKYKNLQYYYNKYKGVDSIVGDCGIPWDPSNKSVKDLSVYQMLYSMLIPREGGNFIVKSYAVNYNLQFLSLLYLASCKFEKLFIFRASRNIWSPEIYIVGIGKKKLSEHEVSNLFDITKGLEDGKVIYPTSNVGADFSLEYEYHTQNVTGMYSDIKKFFVYLARNPEEFKNEQNNLEAFVHRKNIVWLNDNMGFLDGYKEKYIKYSKQSSVDVDS